MVAGVAGRGDSLTAFVGAARAVAQRPEIAGDRLLDHVKFLASDDLKGRANGTPELDRAADYVKEQFQSAGLQPGWMDDWTQPFELVAGLTIGPGNELRIESAGTAIRLQLGASYFPLAATATESPATASATLDNVPLVFAGYGLSVAGQGGYDDYANVDVSGKAVLIFSHEPQERDPGSRLNGSRPMPQTTLQAKAAAARSHGARALLVVSDPTHRVDDADYRLFAFDPDAENVGLPVLRLRRDEMKPLLDAWGLDSVAREIDRDLVPRSHPLPAAQRTLFRAPVHQSADRPERRRRAPGQRSAKGRRDDRDWRSLRPRRHRGASFGGARTNRRDSQRRRRQRLGHRGDHRNRPCRQRSRDRASRAR